MTLRLVVLASGRGSNLRSIASAIDAKECDATIEAVVSDKSDAPALLFAAERNIPTRVVELRSKSERSEWDALLAKTVAEFTPDVVVLAGFMRIVGDAMLARFPHRIVNVHPALLPSFKGAHAPADAIAAGARISGCTVHIVDAGVDTGPTLAQAAVPVMPDDDAESLHKRIQKAEHRLLPHSLHLIATGAIVLGPVPRFSVSADEQRTLFSPDLPQTP